MKRFHSMWGGLGVAACVFLLAGCESMPPEPTYEQAADLSLQGANYRALDALMGRYQRPAHASNRAGGEAGPIIVATLANIDRLEESSTLGRTVSEHLVSRLVQTGYPVVETKVRNSVHLKQNQGEFLLTRDFLNVASSHKAQAVIVGTYGVSERFVHISLKLIDPASSRILSAHDYSLPLDAHNRSLLRRY